MLLRTHFIRESTLRQSVIVPRGFRATVLTRKVTADLSNSDGFTEACLMVSKTVKPAGRVG